MLTNEQKDQLQKQVAREYEAGFNHIREERDRKRDILKKVLDVNLPKGQVRVNLLWKNMQLEQALFLNDEISVKVLMGDGVLSEEMMENANTVLKYDDLQIEGREMRERIINDNALYGLAVTIVDLWDDDEKLPLSDCVDPLSVIIDPQNYSGSRMRFFGFDRRVARYTVENTKGFQLADKVFATSEEIEKNKRAYADANNLTYVACDDGMVDLYEHYTVFEGKKWLTTWATDRSVLIRAVEIEPLTQFEMKKPTKCKFPIQLHRRKPKPGSAFGVSIADEVLVFQDSISRLTNLQLIQANQQALGPDTFIDDRLGVSTEMLSQGIPGGRLIPVTNTSGLPTQNGIYHSQLPAPSQFIDNMIVALEARAEGTTNINQQAFGNSQPGSQTKAEIQTLQQNTNQILIWIANNYLQGQKEFWTAHYRSYVLYFKGKKSIAIFDKGSPYSASFSRDEFVSDKTTIYIASKSQDAIENDKEFNKLMLIANLYLPNMKPGYSMNDFLRTLGRKSNIRDFDEYKYIAESVDEMNARANLSLLNKNLEVPPPADGEDYMTYLLIYKQALDTPAKAKAVAQYQEAYLTIQKPMEMPVAGQSNQSIAGMAMNNLNQEANTAPSTALIK